MGYMHEVMLCFMLANVIVLCVVWRDHKNEYFDV